MTSSFWHHVDRATPFLFGLGAMAGSFALGVFSMAAEARGISPFASRGYSELATLMIAVPCVSALLWAGVIRMALSFRPALVLGLASVVAACFAGVAIVFVGISHSPSSLYPKTSLFMTPFLGVALAASFVPVLKLARHVEKGEPAQALPVSAAGCAWTLAVATIGLLIAPGFAFRVPCGVAFLFALVGCLRIRALAVGVPGMWVQALRKGALCVAIAGLLVVPVRLWEQRRTRNPAVLAIYQGGIASVHCEVRADGREGDVSFWLVECGSSRGPRVGWDEKSATLLPGKMPQ